RNRTLVWSIRQTGQGREASSAVSPTTQFRSQCIFLIPRRCPALASSILFTCSAENQHISFILQFLEIEPTIESLESGDGPQVLFWDFRLVPAGGSEDVVGVRRIWCLLRGP